MRPNPVSDFSTAAAGRSRDVTHVLSTRSWQDERFCELYMTSCDHCECLSEERRRGAAECRLIRKVEMFSGCLLKVWGKKGISEIYTADWLLKHHEHVITGCLWRRHTAVMFAALVVFSPLKTKSWQINYLRVNVWKYIFMKTNKRKVNTQLPHF